MKKKMYVNILIFFILAAVDQITKMIVNAHIELYRKIEIIPGFFYLTNVRNTGAAWSILSGKSAFFIVAAIAAIFMIFWYLYRNEKISAIYRFGLVMIAAGAFGNLIDRISYAYVIDFMDFYIFGYNFPVFNFADCCITIGAGLLITDILFSKEQV